MLVGSVYTLWGLRSSISGAIGGAFSGRGSAEVEPSRLEQDISLRRIILLIILLIIPITGIYYYFSGSVAGAAIAAVVMTVTGFLFSGVGGWLVGLVGGSNQPISGLTLSTLVVAALLMVAVGVTGLEGVGAVLAVAAVVCCATAVSGDMIQDLKVGHLLGGTPWKMEVAEIISTVIVSFVLVFPIIILHEGSLAAGGIGIGDSELPAPQAGLMAQLAKGIVGGEMPWGLILMGMFLAVALIMIKAPAPMLIAVGMYLPFDTTFAVFVGGVMAWLLKKQIGKSGFDEKRENRSLNIGILAASGFIAGEALTGVLLAGVVLQGIPSLAEFFFGVEELGLYQSWGGWLSIIVFAVVAWGLVRGPIRWSARE
jgi:putative OPT family oligopeptide transporter